jgi:hypothetical protein
MFQVYVNALTSLMAELKEFEGEIASKYWKTGGWGGPITKPTPKAKTAKLLKILAGAKSFSEGLSFTNSTRQLERMYALLQNKPLIAHAEISAMIAELRIRIDEDLQDRVFFCVTNPIKVQRFFKRSDGLGNTPPGYLVWRNLDEVFDPAILQRFPGIGDDVVEVCQCFVHDCHTACVFHLMRVVEFGILKVAKLADIQDPKASWGAILDKLEKYAFKTKFAELPSKIQPHIGLIKNLLPKLHAIQHSWRNKITHVENKLIPTDAVDEDVALEIMNAVQAFMRMLAKELPQSIT